MLSTDGVERMLAVYGGRASGVADLCTSENQLARTLDKDRTVLAAEVVFAIRAEFAQTLEDIVFRRLMIGFNADQGRALYEDVAALAAAEAGWNPKTVAQQLRQLGEYAASLRVGY